MDCPVDFKPKEKSPKRRVITNSRLDLHIERDRLRKEVYELKQQLCNERTNCTALENSNTALTQELDELKRKLQKQKLLNHASVVKERETRKELKMLKKYTDGDGLNLEKIAMQREKKIQLKQELEAMTVSYQELKRRYKTDVAAFQTEVAKQTKQKNALLKYYEELQAGHKQADERFAAELQAEKQRSHALTVELERISVSQRDISQTYKTDVENARVQADNLFQQLQEEIKAHADTVSESRLLIQNLLAEKNSLCQKMAEEFNTLQEGATEKVKTLERQLEDLQNQLNAQRALNFLFNKMPAGVKDEVVDCPSPTTTPVAHAQGPVPKTEDKDRQETSQWLWREDHLN